MRTDDTALRDEPVPREILQRVLENARFAPSGGNRQGWRVVAVEDADRRALRDLYLPHWRAYMEHTGRAAMLADPGAHDPRAACGWCSAPTSSPSGSTRCPLHLVVGVRLGDLAIVDAGLPARASSAAPPSTRSCRTCCWGCAPRASAPR